MQQLQMSAQAFHRTPSRCSGQALKLARTIADLTGEPEIKTHHPAEAIKYLPQRRDSKVMAALFEDAHDLAAFGDWAFHDPVEMARLRERRSIQVWATPRKDVRHPWPEEFRQFATRLRRRIETASSVLITVFNIEHPASRSLSRLIARMATRLLASTCLSSSDRSWPT
jgi:hypothetical protein